MGAEQADPGAEQKICGPGTSQLIRQRGFLGALEMVGDLSKLDWRSDPVSAEQVVYCKPNCPGEQQRSVGVFGLRIQLAPTCGMAALQGLEAGPLSLTSEAIISDAIAKPSAEHME